MLYAIWYHLYNLKNVKNTHGGVLLLVNCTNGTKSRNASHIKKEMMTCSKFLAKTEQVWIKYS